MKEKWLELALVHYPVLNRLGETIGSAITNLDVHDIARAARTFGARRYWLVTPFAEQRQVAEEIVGHWLEGYGKTANPDRGEALGLRWEDIDFAKDTISVSRAVSYTSNQPILSSTKTKNGVRTIPLNPQLKELLKPIETEGFVIGGEKPITKMVYIRLFRNISKVFNLHGATAHVFRHSYLSLLNQAGVDPKTIQAIGGHGNFLMTYDLYVHTNGEQIASAGEKVNELLSS